MQRSTTVSERIVTAVWVLVTAVWCSLALSVILSYRGGTVASTWSARFVMMLSAGAVTTGVVLVVRAAWRRSLKRPLPGGRLNGWIVRRPGWQLALFYWVILGLPPLVENLRTAHAEHQVPSARMLAISLASSVVGSSFIALVMRVVWHRQAENVKVPSGGSPGGDGAHPTNHRLGASAASDEGHNLQ
jgi:hypothetical protein